MTDRAFKSVAFRLAAGVACAVASAEAAVSGGDLVQRPVEGLGVESNYAFRDRLAVRHPLRLATDAPAVGEGEVLQGCFRLEDEVNARGRPRVKTGTRTYMRLFSPRMTHSGRVR